MDNKIQSFLFNRFHHVLLHVQGVFRRGGELQPPEWLYETFGLLAASTTLEVVTVRLALVPWSIRPRLGVLEDMVAIMSEPARMLGEGKLKFEVVVIGKKIVEMVKVGKTAENVNGWTGSWSGLQALVELSKHSPGPVRGRRIATGFRG